MSYVNKAVRGFIFVFGFSVIASFLGYLYRLFMARSLTVAEYGLFFSIYVFYWFLQYFNDFGIAQSLGKLLPEFLAKNHKKKARDSILTAYLFEIIMTFAVVLLVLLLADFLSVFYFKSSVQNILLLFTLVFIFKSFSNLSSLILQGCQRMLSYSLIHFFENFFIICFLFLFFTYEQSVIYVVHAFMLAYFLLAIVTGTMAFRNLNLKKARFSFPMLKKLLNFGFPIFMGGLASLVYLYTDTLILTYFRTFQEVGAYNVVVSSAMLLNFVGTATSVVLLPLLSEMIAKNLHKQLKKGLFIAYKYMFFLALPPTIIFLAFPKLFITLLFGESYGFGYPALQILVIGILFLILSSMATQSIIAAGKPGVITKIAVIAALLNFAMNMMFIPKYGFIAAAWTSAICYLIMFASTQFYAKKILDINLPYFSWLKIFIAGVLFLISIYTLKSYLEFPVLVETAITIAIAGTVYLFANFALKSITMGDIRFIMKHLKKK